MTYLLVLLLSLNLFANDQFQELRDDQSIPSQCQEVNFDFFPLPVEFFTYGRENAAEVGFTFEYPVKRGEATLLWNYFKSVVAGHPDENLYEKIAKDPDLLRDCEIINNSYKEMGFDFHNEGEILEVLAVEDLYNEFPSNHYFITGGVEYHHSPDSNTIGEIDIFVGLRKSCEVVAIGEVKLGWKSAQKKARKQLARFSNFLTEYEAGPVVGEYKPEGYILQPLSIAK